MGGAASSAVAAGKSITWRGPDAVYLGCCAGSLLQAGLGVPAGPPGLLGMGRGSGCPLSLGLAVSGVQVGSATSSSGCAQGWMGRSIYPFL